MLPLGFAGTFRRSEIIAINIECISFNAKGMAIKINNSKTDQEKQGNIKIILCANDKTFCTITTVQSWIHKAKLKNGGLFRGISKENNHMNLIV